MLDAEFVVIVASRSLIPVFFFTNTHSMLANKHILLRSVLAACFFLLFIPRLPLTRTCGEKARAADNTPSVAEPSVAGSAPVFEAEAIQFRTFQRDTFAKLKALLGHLEARTPPPPALVSALEDRTYLRVQCWCSMGLGNRLSGIISGFGLALADAWLSGKRRAVLIDYPLGDCRGARTWWDHDGIDWEWPKRGRQECDGGNGNVPDSAASRLTIGEVATMITSGTLRPLLHSLFADAYSDPGNVTTPAFTGTSHAACRPFPTNGINFVFPGPLTSKFFALLKMNLTMCYPAQMWHFSSADYLIPLLEANPHYSPWFLQMFPKGDTFFRLANAFWQPTEEVVAKVNAFKTAHFGRPTIGIQIRTRKHTWTFPGMDRFWDAALLVARERGVLSQVHQGRAGVSTNQTAAGLRFFIAKDKADLELPEWMAPFSLSYTPQSSLKKLDARWNPSTDDEAVVDMLLLAASDEIVMTFASSFGHVAAGLVGKIPYVVEHKNAGISTVTRALSSEPCVYHSQRTLVSWGNTPANKSVEFEAGVAKTLHKDEGSLRRHEALAREAGKAWLAYYGHRHVGECTW